MPRSAQNGSPWEQRARLPARWRGRPVSVREMADQEPGTRNGGARWRHMHAKLSDSVTEALRPFRAPDNC